MCTCKNIFLLAPCWSLDLHGTFHQKTPGSVVPSSSRCPEFSCCLLTAHGSCFSVWCPSLCLLVPLSVPLPQTGRLDHWKNYLVIQHIGSLGFILSLPDSLTTLSVLLPKSLSLIGHPLPSLSFKKKPSWPLSQTISIASDWFAYLLCHPFLLCFESERSSWNTALTSPFSNLSTVFITGARLSSRMRHKRLPAFSLPLSSHLYLPSFPL